MCTCSEMWMWCEVCTPDADERKRAELNFLGVDVYEEMTELEIVEGVNPADVVAVDDWQLVGANDGDRY